MAMDMAEVLAKGMVEGMVEGTAITWAAMAITWAVTALIRADMVREAAGNNQEHKGADFCSAPFI
jgi:hypothetical protein